MEVDIGENFPVQDRKLKSIDSTWMLWVRPASLPSWVPYRNSPPNQSRSKNLITALTPAPHRDWQHCGPVLAVETPISMPCLESSCKAQCRTRIMGGLKRTFARWCSGCGSKVYAKSAYTPAHKGTLFETIAGRDTWPHGCLMLYKTSWKANVRALNARAPTARLGRQLLALSRD